MKKLHPRLTDGQRIDILLSNADHKKVSRGGRWQATVKDLRTGIIYVLRGASCGLPGCYCDAIAKIKVGKS